MGLLLNVTTETKPAPSAAAPQNKPASSAASSQHKPRKRPRPETEEKVRGGPLSSSLFTCNPVIPVLQETSKPQQPDVLFEEASFDDLQISSNIKGNVKTEFKCETMTRVQKEAIPVILSKRDVQIRSPTGSGKTLAYTIPILHFLQALQPPISRTDGLYALVILPTRELVLQTHSVLEKLCRAHVRIVPGLLMGGEKKKSEKARLRKGVNILVGTPGRLADHLRTTSCLSFSRTQMLVLDEADKLVEMGFMKDVKYIISKIREANLIAHQTVLLSATITKGLEELSELSLNNPVHVAIGTDEADEGDDVTNYHIPSQLVQNFIILPTKLRLVCLLGFVADKRKKKVIVFLSCKDSVEYHYQITSMVLSKYFEDEKFTLFKLHGSMEQADRMPVYKKFSTCDSGILFTTDVAARGLDMQSIHWILQYDCPGTVKDYVHRVGRTARAGNKGRALLFLNPCESSYIETLNEKGVNISQIKYEGCMEMLKKMIHLKRIEDAASQLQRNVEDYCKDRENKGLAIRAFQSFARAYRSSHFKDNFKDLHLGHVAKTFGLTEAPSAFLHKNLSRKKQVEARKEHNFQRVTYKHSDENKKKKKKKRKLNLVSDSDMAGLALLSGPRPKKDRL